MSKTRAFTLLEVCLTSALGLLLLAMLSEVLLPGLRASAQNSTRIDLQQQALVVLARLASDLRQSSSAGVGLYSQASGQRVISIQKVVGVSSTTPPFPIFDRQLTVYTYEPTELRLRRRLWPDELSSTTSLDGKLEVPDPLSALRPEPDSLQYFLTHPGRKDSLLGRDLARLDIASALPEPDVKGPIVLTILARQAVAGRRDPLEFEVSQSVSLRNSE